MSKKLQKPWLFLAGSLAFSLTALPTQASPIQYAFNTTVSSSSISGVSVGNAAKITVTLDNGGSGLISQTWTTATDLKSVIFDFNNGGLLTTFFTPWGGGLTASAGNFATNASGVLTSVMTSWEDYDVGTDFTTNGQTPGSWFLNGQNGVYLDPSSLNSISVNNVGLVRTPSSWTLVQQNNVPAPGTLWLMLPGLAALRAFGKRQKA
ncbi:MAG: PEP-CTERM sorting domain-containing protein [Proteobacteria bacterium]|nr:PEP-CTERM sorting domain-containing protein [Pseudomonadota bacterium]